MDILKKLEEQQIRYLEISSADLLFNFLGYKITHKDKNNICYKNKKGSHIYFNNYNKTVDVSNGKNRNKILTLTQIDAINKKIIELGWLKK